jgi:hypothetical protein
LTTRESARPHGLTIRAHAADADRLEAGADRTVAGATTIGGDIEIVPVPGKSPGEIVSTCHAAAR